MSDADCAVIGAGVVGLAIARSLARSGLNTLLLEQHARYGTEISARNSAVIHSGVYYDKSSLKSRLCLHGRDLLYAFCSQHGIAHQQCGKLIVAVDTAEERRLEKYHANASDLDIPNIRMLGAAEVHCLEPALTVRSALWIPVAGIIDTHALMTTLLGEFEQASGILATRTAVTGIRRTEHDFALTLRDAATPLRVRNVINAAGLQATALAQRVEGINQACIPRLYLAKGNYFEYASSAPFRRLIYPIPVDGGLGVHVTLDLAGRMRFGPDVEWIDAVNYAVAPERVASFYPAIRRYWPELPDHSLQPAFAGVRPKLSGPGEPAADFCIQDSGAHGVPGLTCLYGIESPGLTASLAIGEEVARRVQECALR